MKKGMVLLLRLLVPRKIINFYIFVYEQIEVVLVGGLKSLQTINGFWFSH